MKKTIFTLISLFMALGTAFSQNEDDLIIQPTHVTARRVNTAGEITKEFSSDFSYYQNGKLSGYSFPEYALTASFTYAGDYLTHERIVHEGGYPAYSENNYYTYVDGCIQSVSHLTDMGLSVFFEYSYDDKGRLERKDKREDVDPYDTAYHEHWLYDYSDDGLTVTESYCTSWLAQGWRLRQKTTSRFDQNYILSSEQVEEYDLEGDLTSTTMTEYTYTSGGLLEGKTTQSLHDGAWVNTCVTRFAYDEEDHVTEQLEGVWDAESGDWTHTRKTTFERTEDGEKLVVSFYKKNGDDWVWDTFTGQTILFEPYLKPQRMALFYLVYEDYHGNANVNQIEFTLEYTNRPTYLSAEKHPEPTVSVFPTPGSGKLMVETPVEHAVIRFYDLQGRMMLARPFDLRTEINATGWPSGVYLWEIWRDDQKLGCGKWVKN